MPGELSTLSILRNGKPKDIKFKAQLRNFLVPILPYQIAPSYYIIGGLVFVPLTLMLIDRLLEEDDDASGLADYTGAEQIVEEQQKLVLVDILLTDMTEGYESNFQILSSINDNLIINLEHMYEVMKEQLKKSKYIVFEYENSDQKMILRSADVKKYSQNIAVDQLGVSTIYFNIPDWTPTSKVADLPKKMIKKK